MCINASQWNPSIPHHPPHYLLYRPKRSKVRVNRLRLIRGKRSRMEREVGLVGKEIELKNLKLYLENRSIIEENEKLREKAILLHQENRALMSQLQMKFSHLHDFSNKSSPA
ncbi:hypothetical protein BVC80_1827g91 [Macleaya cordata]|uniref:Uncharacterized protein n=1 Tax=Macleaya cordata TaxID=56857 RepID=A0A200QB78_MACCD|nr:hypothetical protein BVC80_1827g91 [Macleaya cordata]